MEFEDEAQKREIDGKTYYVAPFLAIEGARLQCELIKIASPLVAGLIGNGVDKEINASSLASAVGGVAAELSPDRFIALCQKLLRNVTVEFEKKDGSKGVAVFGDDFEAVFNVAFKNSVLSLYKVIAFVLEVNFPDFFSALKGKKSLSVGARTAQTDLFGKQTSE